MAPEGAIGCCFEEQLDQLLVKTMVLPSSRHDSVSAASSTVSLLSANVSTIATGAVSLPTATRPKFAAAAPPRRIQTSLGPLG